MKPHQICRAGVGRTFQNIRLFKNLPVLDNVMIALQQNVRYGLVAAFLHGPKQVRAEQRDPRREPGDAADHATRRQG